jgi:hypothetical protein
MLTQRLNEKSLYKTVFELNLVFFSSLVYFSLITLLVRHSLRFEVFLCIVFPFSVHIIKKTLNLKINYRVMQLIIIESCFMLFVILGKISITYDYPKINSFIGYGFRSLFIIQFCFFMLYQHKVNSYRGLCRTLMFLVLLIPWFSHASLASNIDADGRFFFSGVLAPDYIILYYCFWVIGVPLVDSKTLPNFLTATLHVSSVVIALLSQEFFHVRLLTASHLFILDYLASYSTPHDKQFGVLSHKQFMAYEKIIKPIIDHTTLYACGFIFVYVFLYRV